MSRSNDAAHFFQTSNALASSQRRAVKAKNKHGKPISLPSKILAVHIDPHHEGAVLVAEAAAQVDRVLLENGEVKTLSTKATAPLTSLAICENPRMLFAGCWDKTVYGTPLELGGPFKHLDGHTDFVKCVLSTCLSGKPVLISGSADATMIVWDISTSRPLHKLKGHVKALQHLALDPLSIPQGAAVPTDSLIVFSASSDREIRRWHVSLDTAHEVPESIEAPILAHETSVYKLCFDSEGDVWTASADKTAKHLVRSRTWEADTVLQHPDFVRDVVVAENLGLVATACRDEEVRIWDLASGDLLCTYSGHYEEVTGLVVIGRMVVSVSIDGTVRQWSLDKQDMLRYQEEMKLQEGDEGAKTGEPEKGGSMLTAEEEAELADLMEDEDE